MRDHSHSSPADTGYCEHCGQPLPAAARVPSYGTARVNRTGLAITVGLHLALILLYIFRDQSEQHAAPPAASSMVYIQAAKSKPQQARPHKPVRTAPVNIVRLPNTITLPEEKPVVQEEPKKTEVPPEMDMAAYIEARRKARGAAPEAAPGESEAERGLRLAKANIAAANGRSAGDDRNETGGVFSLSRQSFSSADLKFRGWNPNFKRRWLQQVTVELGLEPDIETAVIKKMIELIRKEKTGDFEWESHRLQRTVTMSARLQDTAELHAFLLKEMFPTYQAARR